MKNLLAASLLCICASVAAHAASPWDGTWKLNRAKSHLTGSSYTYSQVANGKWHVSIGPLGLDITTDGKPYPVFDNDHMSMTTMPDAHTLKTVNQFKGKTMSTSIDTLSADGNTISDITTGVHEDGTTYTTTETDVRSGPGSGFLGTWTSTKESNSAPSIFMISTASNGMVTFTNPTSKSTLTVKLDGTPAAPVGPSETEGVMVAYKAVSPRRLDYSVTLKGKKIVDGYDELSADGKTYTEVSWLVGKMSEKTTSVYDKQ